MSSISESSGLSLLVLDSSMCFALRKYVLLDSNVEDCYSLRMMGREAPAPNESNEVDVTDSLPPAPLRGPPPGESH